MVPKPKDLFDVAVVGAGAIGLSVAWRAARQGLRVCVLERGAPGCGTSHVAAGMLAPVAEAAFGETALVELKLESAGLWPAFAAELAEDSGLHPGYRQTGTLYVARDRDAAEALVREAAFRRSLGLSLEELLPSEARRREPALVPSLRSALSLPTDHTADPVALVEALAAAARARGVELRCGAEVTAVAAEQRGQPTSFRNRVTAEQRGQPNSFRNRVVGVRLAGGETIAAERVVVAAGPWSSAIAGAGEHVPVRPVKGQVLRLRDREGPGLLTTVLRTEHVYVVPRGDGRYVVGASVEEKGFDVQISAGATYELLRDAAEVLPGVLELDLEEAVAGLRPTTPDNLPVIGASEQLAGLVWATGHYRHGILLAPVTARLVEGILTGEAAAGESSHWRPGRFSAAEAPA